MGLGSARVAIHGSAEVTVAPNEPPVDGEILCWDWRTPHRWDKSERVPLADIWRNR